MSEQHLDQQGLPPPADQQEVPPEDLGAYAGGATDQPDAVTRDDRAQQHALTPAEERQALNERLKAKRDAEREERLRQYEEQQQQLTEQPLVQDQMPEPDRGQDPYQQAEGGEPRKYRLRYNHADVYLTEEEMVRQAQIGMASQDRLAEIQRTLAEIKATRNNLIRQPDSAHQAEPSTDTSEPDRPRTKGAVNLREVVENIQTGDADDGVSALETFKADIMQEIRREAPPQSSPDQVATQVEQRLQSRAADQMFRRYFQERHPELVGRRGLITETEDRLHQVMLNELRSLRRDDGKMLSEQELAPAVRDPTTALRWAATYALQGVKRANGEPMANPVQMMDFAADSIKYEFGLLRPQQQQQPRQQPARPDQDRQLRLREEKRNLSEPRPAQTGYRQGGQGQQARMTPEQRRSAAVAQRRAATGFDRFQ